MSDRLATGKVPWNLVAEHVRGPLPPEVVLGPAHGEDAALVRLGGELWAVASDPVTFAAHGAGQLAVIVNANDVAVRGAVPRFFLAVVLLAESEATPDRAAELLDEVRAACVELGVTLIGGHTEVAPGIDHSLVCGTALGPVAGRPITTAGLRPGDRVGLVRTAGLEGTAILWGEWGPRLAPLHPAGAFPANEVAADPARLLVVREALAAAACPAVSALHDVTEGGVGEALYELGQASGCVVAARREDVPVLASTRALCRDLGLDALGLIGSGALLVGCAEDGARKLEEALAMIDAPLAWIGRAHAAPAVVATLPRFERDELLKAGLLAHLRGFVFDLDGTLVESDYDWPAIRRELGVAGPSIVDALNGLPEPERSRRWARLETIEREATAAAHLRPGARDLIGWLRGQGLPCALVTNNTAENTASLLERFGLGFDVVITRDDGLWKPSGAPVREAARRLGVAVEACAKVGDGRYDVLAGRDAGCGAVVLVRLAGYDLDPRPDLVFPDPEALWRGLRGSWR